MERLKSIKDNLIAAVQCQDISSADAKEMGEVVDMIKDIEEAIYYCTIKIYLLSLLPNPL